MTTREILAEIDMAGLVVSVTRVMEPGHPQAWWANIRKPGANWVRDTHGPSFDAALLAAWNAHAVKVAA